MQEIKSNIKEKGKQYSVFAGRKAVNLIKSYLEKKHSGKKIVVVTDSNVKNLCSDAILKELSGLRPYLIVIPAGEASKSREMKERIEDHLLKKKYGRDTVMIAVGGGMIGDLAGFTASTYNRGIPIIHVPTTLLAMVDSSIGGKTSVNTKHGKNLIGATYQPDAVFTDLDFLKPLPQEEFINGMAEIIKIASTSDKELFSFIEKNMKKILEKDENALLCIIKRSIELKKEVVEKDEKEQGLRQILNFGHTFGHALESYTDYKLKHGHCVSIGLAVEAKISEIVNGLSNKECKKILLLLKNIGLPAKMEKNIDADKLIEIMKSDKKALNQKPRFVMLDKIGKIKSNKDVFSFEADGAVIKKAIELCKGA